VEVLCRSEEISFHTGAERGWADLPASTEKIFKHLAAGAIWL
jgi:hypothetical protein